MRGIPRASRLRADSPTVVVDGTGRPRATVLMPVYQQAEFVREALESVLTQDAPCEIVLSDDASTDATLEVALQTLRDAPPTAHRIILRRGTRRLRRQHIPELARVATTAVLVQAHGDDVAYPDRVRSLVEAMDETGAAFIASTSRVIDASGTPRAAAAGAEYWDGVRTFTVADAVSCPEWCIGAVQAWQPARLALFAPLDDEYAPMSHDRIIPFRAALLGAAAVIGRPLLDRRVHAANWSRTLVDRSSRGAARHGFALARMMALDVMEHDVRRAAASGEIDAATAERAAGAIGERRRESGEELRRTHGVLLRDGRALGWTAGE